MSAGVLESGQHCLLRRHIDIFRTTYIHAHLGHTMIIRSFLQPTAELVSAKTLRDVSVCKTINMYLKNKNCYKNIDLRLVKRCLIFFTVCHNILQSKSQHD